MIDGKKFLLLDVDLQGNLTKILGQRKPHDLPMILAMVAETEPISHLEIMQPL